jgi:hypothetical protein
VLFPKLPAAFHNGQDSGVVGPLVAGLKHRHVAPTPRRCHVGVGEMFPCRYPAAAIGVPEASVPGLAQITVRLLAPRPLQRVLVLPLPPSAETTGRCSRPASEGSCPSSPPIGNRRASSCAPSRRGSSIPASHCCLGELMQHRGERDSTNELRKAAGC